MTRKRSTSTRTHEDNAIRVRKPQGSAFWEQISDRWRAVFCDHNLHQSVKTTVTASAHRHAQRLLDGDAVPRLRTFIARVAESDDDDTLVILETDRIRKLSPVEVVRYRRIVRLVECRNHGWIIVRDDKTGDQTGYSCTDYCGDPPLSGLRRSCYWRTFRTHCRRKGIIHGICGQSASILTGRHDVGLLLAGVEKSLQFSEPLQRCRIFMNVRVLAVRAGAERRKFVFARRIRHSPIMSLG